MDDIERRNLHEQIGHLTIYVRQLHTLIDRHGLKDAKTEAEQLHLEKVRCSLSDDPLREILDLIEDKKPLPRG